MFIPPSPVVSRQTLRLVENGSDGQRAMFNTDQDVIWLRSSCVAIALRHGNREVSTVARYADQLQFLDGVTRAFQSYCNQIDTFLIDHSSSLEVVIMLDVVDTPHVQSGSYDLQLSPLPHDPAQTVFTVVDDSGEPSPLIPKPVMLREVILSSLNHLTEPQKAEHSFLQVVRDLQQGVGGLGDNLALIKALRVFQLGQQHQNELFG